MSPSWSMNSASASTSTNIDLHLTFVCLDVWKIYMSRKYGHTTPGSKGQFMILTNSSKSIVPEPSASIWVFGSWELPGCANIFEMMGKLFSQLVYFIIAEFSPDHELLDSTDRGQSVQQRHKYEKTTVHPSTFVNDHLSSHILKEMMVHPRAF